MADELLPYFNRELVAIRRLAAEFAQTHPKIAGRLRLSPEAVDDPHVARLLDGVAFLSARAQARLDDEFPELTDTLLGVLYPHFLSPFPSCAIAQFTPKTDLQAVVDLPAGFVVDTEAVRGQSCRFRTANNLSLSPIKIESARLMGLPFTAPPNPQAAGANAVLRLVLTTLAPEGKFSLLGLDKVRLFVRGGPAALPLFEALAGHTLSVALADGPYDAAPVLLPKTALSQVGFAPEEALLPWPARSFSGFRLLSEYFAFPQKFMFVEIAGLEAKTMLTETNKLEIFIYLARSSAELERSVNAEAFALGCVPIVNLFHQRCEPIDLDHTATEYRVLPDARRSGVMEVWAVTNVREVRPDTTSRPWAPFYRLSADGGKATGNEGGFYHEVRRGAAPAVGGSDTFLAPYDAQFDPNQKTDSVLSVEALCLNRDLPAELPFGGGHPRLTALNPHSALAQMSCLTPPTPTLRPEYRARGAWRLISHLSLGHLSVTGGAEGAAALKEVLRLYDLRNTSETRAAIEALLAVNAAPGAARVPGSRLGAFCRGLDVELEFEPRAFQASGLFLLASVLDRFLALHATVNSFVRSTVRLRGRADPETKFPPRAGARVLL